MPDQSVGKPKSDPQGRTAPSITSFPKKDMPIKSAMVIDDDKRVLILFTTQRQCGGWHVKPWKGVTQ